MAESERAALSTQRLDRRIPDKTKLIAEVNAGRNVLNKRGVRIVQTIGLPLAFMARSSVATPSGQVLFLAVWRKRGERVRWLGKRPNRRSRPDISLIVKHLPLSAGGRKPR